MKSLLTWLSRRRFPYEPLIEIDISKQRLLHNLQEFRRLAPMGAVAPVLKSNAYGHGLFEVAGILKHEQSIPFFVVDSYFEAVALRARRICIPLLIIGYTRPETMLASRLKLTAFTVTSMETLEKIKHAEHPVRIHLKIDTGMHRQGILPEEADAAISLLQENSSLMLEGICSHLCDADNADPSFTEGQINTWNKLVRKFKAAFPSVKYMHLSATDGHLFSSGIDANVSRLGIGLYGLSENNALNEKLDLHPVLSLRTIITDIKKLKVGETVGYGNTFKADRDMTIATIPVGYFEGLDRRLSDKGMVQVGTERIPCRIIGRVSMNISSIDISSVVGAKVGDEVVVISAETAHPNSFAAMAKLCGSITYEGAVKIPGHLKRKVV